MYASRAYPAPFVGRHNEFAAMVASLEAARNGQGGLVCVTGEPGIGKSRLLREVANHARESGWRVLFGRAYDVEGMPPYLPFLEALRDDLCTSADDRFSAFAAGAPALVDLLPELRRRLPARPPVTSAGPDAERFRLFEAVSTFLTESASRREPGVMLVLDDLQWADTTTLLLLQHLTRKLATAPLFVAVAYRSTELGEGHPIDSMRADLSREHLCDTIHLAPLSDRDTFALVVHATGEAPPESFTRALHRETSGNPFFIEAVLRQLLEKGTDLSLAGANAHAEVPDSVRQVIRQRLSRLLPETLAVLQAASVLGDSFDLDLLSSVASIGAERVAAALEEAERAALVRPDGQSYEFAHSLIRRTIYDELSMARRRHIHQQAAGAMEVAAFMPITAGPAAIGNHWRHGGRPDLATSYLLRAGDAAIGLTAWSDAIRHWEAAAECMEHSGAPAAVRASLFEGLGELHFLNSFEAHPSADRYEKAAELYQELGDELSAARATANAGRSLLYPSAGFDFDRALHHLRAAEPVLARGPMRVELGELYASLAHAETHVLGSIPEEVIESQRRVREVAAKLDNEFLRDYLDVQSDHLQGHYLGLQGHLAEGLAFEERACAKAAELKNRSGAVNEWPARWREFFQLHSDGRTPDVSGDQGSLEFSRVASRAQLANLTINCCGWQSLDLLDPVRARAKHERLKDPQGRYLSPFLIYDMFLLGDLGRIRELIDAGSLSPFGDAINRAPYLSAWGEGRMAEAEAGLAQGAARWRDAQSRQLITFTNQYTVRLYRVIGQPAKARATAEESLRIALTGCAVKYEFAARSELSLLLAEAGCLPEAETQLRRCREILAEGEDWRGLGLRQSLAESAFAAASGRHEDAAASFQRTAEGFRSLCLPWDEAETYESWARSCAHFSRGRIRRAFVDEKLASARAVYERIGAGQPWLDRLAALKRGLIGAASAHSAHELPDKLTPREAEILAMVAAGCSSREVGEQLFLSVRTVERHIANAYLKTGTHNRAQLTAYALSHALAETR